MVQKYSRRYLIMDHIVQNKIILCEFYNALYLWRLCDNEGEVLPLDVELVLHSHPVRCHPLRQYQEYKQRLLLSIQTCGGRKKNPSCKISKHILKCYRRWALTKLTTSTTHGSKKHSPHTKMLLNFSYFIWLFLSFTIFLLDYQM